jgi:glutathione S-transferase
MGVYQIIGRRGAGSLIAEFLLDVAGEPYEIEFLSRGKIHDPAFREVNPVGKIPVMTCPDGSRIFETIAIVAHLIERFPSLAPAMNTPERDLHWQYLALFATNLYPAYHRQHHTAYYVSENGFEDVRRRARAEQAITFDYIEGLLDPYLFGDSIMAADFYLYMLLRWDLDKPALVAERPKIAAFMTAMRGHPSVDRVITAQRPKQPGN